MAGIFYLSAQSNPPAPSRIPDKVQHAVEYFGFGLVVVRAVAGGLGRQVTAAHVKATMLIVVVYAISDELHQLFVPLRTADVRDALADVAGASIALLACWAWHIIAAPRNRLPKPKS